MTYLEPKQCCECQCGMGGPCGHDWEGPTAHIPGIDREGNPYLAGETKTCSKCGMSAMTHTIWL